MPRRRTLFARNDVAPRTFIGQDDVKNFVLRRDFTGGVNNRQHPSVILENECKAILNVDLTTPGQASRRSGITLIEDVSNNVGTGAFGFEPQGGTGNLLITEGTYLRNWNGGGSFSDVKTDLTTGLITKMIKTFKTGTGDVVLVSNGTDNVFEFNASLTEVDLGDTNTSPPKTIIMEAFRNRVWMLLNDQLYYSSASPSDYSAAFDRTTNWYRIPVGEERALYATRDLGLLIAGKDQVWALNPSTVPAATDKPEKMSDYGCAAGRTFAQLGDDYLYLAYDGVRGLRRTALDKLQYGTSLPMSYKLKDEFNSINWGHVSKSTAVVWDNKYFIALPTTGSSTNNRVWVYFPATNGWSVISGWNVGAWATFKVGGEELLYFIDSTDGKIYRAWSGASDNTVSIEYSLEGRNEDLGAPLIKKYGGELKIVAKPAGNYNISVYGSFDSGAYNLFGYLHTSGNLITFPITFPVYFYPDQTVYKKFPLDFYGEWYQFRFKVSHNSVTTNADDITVLEASLTATNQEYDPEESV